MRIFLLWRRDTGPGAALDPADVAPALQDVFRPLFGQPLEVGVEGNAAAGMVFAQLPVRGWAAPFRQADEHGRAYATDYPVGVRRVLGEGVGGSAPFARDAELPALGRRLERDPGPVVRELPPPFALVWWPRGRDEALLHTDGLGQAQVFEYDDGALWAATNKIAALRALGVRLEPDPLDWATKCTLGWFPLDRSGYARVTYAAPGTRVLLTPGGVRRTTVDVVGEWVHPAPMAREEALELGRAAMIRHVRDGARHFDSRPAAGLSGGWDTRAVVASFVAAGVGVRAKVKGQEGQYDVPIARRLAQIAGLDLQVRPKSGMPPERTDDLERSLRLALLWQGGHMWRESHKAFLAGDERRGDGGALNVMGQHGEIARGYYELRAGRPDGAVAYLMEGAPAALRPEVRDAVRERVHEVWAQAAGYGLDGLAALDFLYLFERTRRHNSASLASQFGLVFTPFLTPDVIRAAYALRAAGEPFVRDGRELNPLHRYVIATNTPGWAGVEFESDVSRAAAAAPAQGPARRDWREARGRRYYDYDLYWREVGRPLADRITRDDGLWTEIFDAGVVRAGAGPAPLDLVLVALMAEALEAAPAA